MVAAVIEFVRRLPQEVARVGGALPWRVGVLALALLANIGFYLPEVRGSAVGAALPGADKIVHVAVFALTVWAAGRLLAPRRRFPMGWVVIIAILHAGLIELIQGVALPDRAADPADVLADVIGIALGVGLWLVERERARRREANRAPLTPPE
ncbi:MAG TPA: VanZ family protein [Candidatus Brachybacterium merdigallinarum]|nr:VanZ family protein [Candidatus Brachybacterium merdigallinarum]